MIPLPSLTGGRSREHSRLAKASVENIIMKPIKVGEEIFTFYDYKRASFPADYPWYHEAQRRINEEL